MLAVNAYKRPQIPTRVPSYRNWKKINPNPITFDGGIYSFSPNVVRGQVSTVVGGNTRTNILTENQASVETDITGFADVGGGVTLTRDTTEKVFGNSSLKAVISGTAVGQGIRVNNTKAQAGKTYTGSIYIKAPLDSTLRLILWRETSSNQNETHFTGTGNWQRIDTSLLVDANTEDLGLWVRTTNTAQAITIYVDGLMIEESDRLNNWINSTKSTISTRLKSVGVNLFDKSKITSSTILNASGDLISTTGYFTSDFIRVKKGKTYFYDNSNTKYVVEYDQNKSKIENTRTSYYSSYTAQHDGYIRFSASDGNNLDTFMLEEDKGQPLGIYEPYTESISYINAGDDLRSLPNGTKDEVSDDKLYKRVSDDVSISNTDYDYLDTTSYTNIDVVRTIAFSDAQAGVAGTAEGSTRYYDKNGNQLTESANATDNVSDIGKYYYGTDKRIYIIVAKGAYADIASARTELGTTSVNYQLAEPIVTSIPDIDLICYPNGTLYVEPGEGILPEETTIPTVTLSTPPGINLPLQISNIDLATSLYLDQDFILGGD